jgi:alpha-L-rhamnosidase
MIRDLRINRRQNPIGIDATDIRFSFKTDKTAGVFTFELFDETEGSPIFTTPIGFMNTHAFAVDYPFQKGKEYCWRIKDGETTSETALFETGIDFDAPFISPKSNMAGITCPVLCKTFLLNKDIKKARLYITGLGLYRAFINGKRVGNDYLTPGFNDYDAYLRYGTYNITGLLKEENKIEVHLGDGWYKSRFGIDGHGGDTWGSEYLLAAKLTFSGDDRQTSEITTDASWLAAPSCVISTSIYDGEERKDSPKRENYVPCKIVPTAYKPVPYFGAPIVEKALLQPELYVSPKGEQILDFKQNMTGFCRFVCRTEKGTVIKLQYSEVLQQECFYNDNLRTAKAEYTYTSDGAVKTVEPFFTFYGFRYVKVSGMERVEPSDFTGVVIYSDLPMTLKIQTANSKINRLIANAQWGQRGNFLDVPTDCPQRDERLGWTADAQVFSNTACFNMDCFPFYTKYLADIRADQRRYYKGDVPMYSPSLKGVAGNGGAVWADAAVIIPWNLYMNYGDRAQLQKDYPMMKDYVETMIARDNADGGSHLIISGFTFGDWLAQDGVSPQSLLGGTDNTFIRSIYYFNSVSLAAQAAGVLGLTKDNDHYAALAEAIKQAVLKEFFSETGRLAAADTQTAHILSLYYGVYKNREKVIESLNTRLRKDLYRIKTGFTGTPLILPALMDNGMINDAYRILFNEECPGWLYAVNLGATTIWERWNSLLPDGSISGINMNSFNHYSYGSVCEAIYSRIAGLRRTAPGWRRAEIKPCPNYRLKQIDMSFDSPCGIYKTGWELLNNGKLVLHVTVPAGITAQITLPAHPGNEVLKVRGGDYEYNYTPVINFLHPFSKKTLLLDLLANDEAREILKQNLPQMYGMVAGENDEFKTMMLDEMPSVAMFGASFEDIERVDLFLKAIAV